MPPSMLKTSDNARRILFIVSKSSVPIFLLNLSWETERT